MHVNLTIDQGNSAAKMAIWRGNEPVDVVIESNLTTNAVERFISRNNVSPANAIYCSVAGNGEEFLKKLRRMIPNVMRLNSQLPLPLAIDYGTPGTLGTDRIAAAAGALSLHPGCPLFVVDAGTAVTYDYVTASGRFAGGNIAPGMTMRLEALHRFTARLPRLEMPRELPADRFLGTDTRSAMILGAVYGIVGALAYYRTRLPADTITVVTGGWATALAKICDFDVDVQPNLVSAGLNSILNFNLSNTNGCPTD